jgi:putative ABC transport system permease protein
MLPVQPILGRTLTAADYQKGAPRAAVISESTWSRLFARRNSIVGEAITLGGQPMTVVGVLPAAFQFPVQPEATDVWTPLEAVGPVEEFLSQRGAHFLDVVGRLKPNATIEQANVELEAIAARLAASYPESNGRRSVRAFPWQERLVADYRLALIMLFGAVFAVLLIACGNVANLLLVRGTGREREMAIRAALGASRWRLARQLLVESVLLSSMAGLLGIAFAQWGLSTLVATSPFNMPRLHDLAIDRGVLLFTTGLSVATGILFGLAPAFQSSGAVVGDALKEAMHSTAGSRSARTRQALIVAEVALSVVLLTSAGLLIRSLAALQHVNPGFVPERVIATDMIPLLGARYREQAAQVAFAARLRDEIAKSPDVSAAAMTTTLPLSGDNLELSFDIEGRPRTPTQRGSATYFAVGPDYFKTMGIHLVSGRAFSERDNEKAPDVIIISDTLARRYWPGGDAIGKRLFIGYNNDVPRQIVGVVADVKNGNLAEQVAPAIYTPFAQTPWQFVSVVVRTNGDAGSVAASIKAAIARLDPDLPVGGVTQLTAYIARTTAPPRFLTTLVSSFAGFAVLLAGCGLFSVMAYFVAQRRRELGIRMALGARMRDVRRLVVQQAVRLGAIGLVIGVAGGLAAGHLYGKLLFGIAPSDPITFAGVSLAFAGVLTVAAYVPARRATQIDPVIALRSE